MFCVISWKDLQAAAIHPRIAYGMSQCCLRRIKHGQYVVMKVCDDPEHDFVQQLASSKTVVFPRTELGGHQWREQELELMVLAEANTIRDDEVFSHLSAALIHKLPTVDIPRVRAETIWTGYYRSRKTLLTRPSLRYGEPVELRGHLRVTDLAHTLVDLALDYKPHVSVPAIDYALRTGSVTDDDLLNAAEDRENQHPGRRLFRALQLSSPLHESPGESVLAVRFKEFNIDGFVWQYEFKRPDGSTEARVDGYREDAGVVIEFDGGEKYGLNGADPHKVFEQERRREYRLRNRGLYVFRFTWDDLWSGEKFIQLKAVVRSRQKSNSTRYRAE